MSDQFKQNLREALLRGTSSSRNLSAFSADMQFYLEQTELFSKVTISKTGNSACALEIVCYLAYPSTTPASVAKKLEQLWMTAPLWYGDDADAYEFEYLADVLTMHFFTVAAYEMTVTGKIDVLGFQSELSN